MFSVFSYINNGMRRHVSKRMYCLVKDSEFWPGVFFPVYLIIG